MAQTRRFSPEIVSSDAFLDMPPSTQALYFQLGMRADDDGFVNPRATMRLVGATKDELKILIGKRFVLLFENGVVVVKHWRINNRVRLDWYRPSKYTEQRKLLFVKENGAYTLDISQGLPLGTDSVPFRTSLVESSLVELPSKDKSLPMTVIKGTGDSEEPLKKEKVDMAYRQVFLLFGGKQGWWHHRPQIDAAKRLLKEPGMDVLKQIMAYVADHKDATYIPKILKPFDLEAKLPDLRYFRNKA